MEGGEFENGVFGSHGNFVETDEHVVGFLAEGAEGTCGAEGACNEGIGTGEHGELGVEGGVGHVGSALGGVPAEGEKTVGDAGGQR